MLEISIDPGDIEHVLEIEKRIVATLGNKIVLVLRSNCSVPGRFIGSSAGNIVEYNDGRRVVGYYCIAVFRDNDENDHLVNAIGVQDLYEVLSIN